ncbi:hypothetical protein [Zobellella denitrificans]
MSELEQLAELDKTLLAALANIDELDQDWLGRQLALRAELLQQVIDRGDVSPEQAAELVGRSRRVKDSAEQARQLLADKLAQMQKGRRSVRAYQSVKRNQE